MKKLQADVIHPVSLPSPSPLLCVNVFTTATRDFKAFCRQGCPPMGERWLTRRWNFAGVNRLRAHFARGPRGYSLQDKQMSRYYCARG